MIRILNVNSLFFVSLTTHLDFQMKLYIQLLQKTIVFEHVFSKDHPLKSSLLPIGSPSIFPLSKTFTPLTNVISIEESKQ